MGRVDLISNHVELFGVARFLYKTLQRVGLTIFAFIDREERTEFFGRVLTNISLGSPMEYFLHVAQILLDDAFRPLLNFFFTFVSQVLTVFRRKHVQDLFGPIHRSEAKLEGVSDVIV